jgi:hypothetical protein
MARTDKIFSLGNDSYFADAFTGIGKGLSTGANVLGKGASGIVGVVQSVPGAVSSAASDVSHATSALFTSDFCRKNPHAKGCSRGGKRTRKCKRILLKKIRNKSKFINK